MNETLDSIWTVPYNIKPAIKYTTWNLNVGQNVEEMNVRGVQTSADGHKRLQTAELLINAAAQIMNTRVVARWWRAVFLLLLFSYSPARKRRRWVQVWWKAGGRRTKTRRRGTAASSSGSGGGGKKGGGINVVSVGPGTCVMIEKPDTYLHTRFIDRIRQHFGCAQPASTLAQLRTFCPS